MGVTCQILINKKPECFHRPGQAVTGIVKYAIDKKTELKKVTLSLLGTAKCTGIVNESKQSRIFHGLEEYVTIHIELLKTPEALEIGAYEFPFEFILPENLPSSFKDDVSVIAYKIELKFEKENLLSSIKTYSTEIPVRGYVEPTDEGPVVFGLEKTLMKLFSTKENVIKLKTEIVKHCIHPGEDLQLTSVVTNETKVAPVVRAEIFCFKTYTANCGNKTTSSIKIKDTNSDSIKIPARGEATITQNVSTNPSLYSISSKVLLKEYRVRMTVRLPVPYVNAYVEMPVVIGERRDLHLKNYSQTKGTSTITPGDAPPSYWEVMSEEKETSDKR